MKTDLNVDEYMEDQRKEFQRHKELQNLIKRYKKNTPIVSPVWDISKESVNYNDVEARYKTPSPVIYEVSFQKLWSTLYKPEVFKAPLWGNSHYRDKIAKIIECWDNKKALSPIFLFKDTQEKVIVLDGKHRLTVA